MYMRLVIPFRLYFECYLQSNLKHQPLTTTVADLNRLFIHYASTTIPYHTITYHIHNRRPYLGWTYQVYVLQMTPYYYEPCQPYAAIIPHQLYQHLRYDTLAFARALTLPIINSLRNFLS
jgi:hypothetical protein